MYLIYAVCGAGDEARTRDLNLGKVALYQLSYPRSELLWNLWWACRRVPPLSEALRPEHSIPWFAAIPTITPSSAKRGGSFKLSLGTGHLVVTCPKRPLAKPLGYRAFTQYHVVLVFIRSLQ